MARNVVKCKKNDIHKKDFKVPMINIFPAIVWSIPLYQFLFPITGKAVTTLFCFGFVFLYVYLSLKAIISVIPCVASVVVFTAMFWALVNGITNGAVKVILKIVILLISLFIELAIFSNATLPWLQYRDSRLEIIKGKDK